jgi:hypothetical protein
MRLLVGSLFLCLWAVSAQAEPYAFIDCESTLPAQIKNNRKVKPIAERSFRLTRKESGVIQFWQDKKVHFMLYPWFGVHHQVSPKVKDLVKTEHTASLFSYQFRIGKNKKVHQISCRKL